jgi:outer membrane protein insertion porin family
MTAKQTTSASLVLLLTAWSPALADDDPDAQPSGEVQPKKLEMMPKREPTGTFEIGAGFSTDESFIATARISQPRLFGTDKGLSLNTLISKRRQEFLVRYEDPTLFDALQLRADLYSRTKLYKGFSREASGTELQLGRRVAPNLDFFVGYKLEGVEVDHDATSLYRGGVVDEPWRGGVISALRTGVRYSTLGPNEHYPRSGTVIGSSLEVADRSLGSSIEYLRTDAWFGHHQPLGGFTLHLSGRVSSITDVPMSERLHFDGSSDVRGYAPGAIMPTGGNLMWTMRTELETPSVEGLSLAGFYDAGGIYMHGVGESIGSVGVGLIWRSPIGPLRFDWAVPLGNEDRAARFLFGIGGGF